jgi:hypothetical protein
MGQSRTEFQTVLEGVLGADRVYFQAPPDINMNYPAIRYERDFDRTRHGDNRPYFRKKRYQVIVIDRNPDSDIPEKVAQLPTAEFERFYTADRLNHFVYRVFF